MPQRYSDHTGRYGDIPEDGGYDAQLVTIELGTQHTGYIIESHCQKAGGHKSKQHGIDVHGPHPSEVDVFDVGHEIRCHQVPCGNKPEGGCHGKPGGGRQGKGFGRLVLKGFNISFFGRHTHSLVQL